MLNVSSDSSSSLMMNWFLFFQSSHVQRSFQFPSRSRLPFYACKSPQLILLLSLLGFLLTSCHCTSPTSYSTAFHYAPSQQDLSQPAKFPENIRALRKQVIAKSGIWWEIWNWDCNRSTRRNIEIIQTTETLTPNSFALKMFERKCSVLWSNVWYGDPCCEEVWWSRIMDSGTSRLWVRCSKRGSWRVDCDRIARYCEVVNVLM